MKLDNQPDNQEKKKRISLFWKWGLCLSGIIWLIAMLVPIAIVILSPGELVVSLTFIAFFLLFASGVAGFLTASWMLQPIRDIKFTLDRISFKSIADTRVIIRDSQDELTDISLGINQLLDRMTHYIDQQVHFVEDASHELRTPVAIVQGHLKMLNRWGKDDPEVLQESIQSALSEIERMRVLVQEMLDLSRAGQVEIHYQDEAVDAGMVVEESYENFKMLHPDFTFILNNELSKPYYVAINRHHLEQCLIILLDNAVKYSTDTPLIHITVSTDVIRYVEIAIQDFGEGLSQEDQDKIFNRFYRVDKARSRERGGNGLGLPIARQLIEGYKGQLFVESSLNSGSVFHIRLPLAEEVDDKVRSAEADSDTD